MAETALTAQERERINKSLPIAGRYRLGTLLGDAQDRIEDLEAVADQAADLVTEALRGPKGANLQAATLAAQNGTGMTPISFVGDAAARVTTTVDGSGGIDLSGVGDGGTIILNPDGAGADTATLNAAAATSVSDATPSTDISAEADSKFRIAVNGGDAEEVTLDLTADGGLDSGAKIATEMQTKIQALGGDFAAVTVDYNVSNAGKYTVTSGQVGNGSAVVITPATSGSITEELKIGEAAGGVETAGTGDCADIAAVTLDELCTLINGDIALVTATNDGEHITISSKTKGVGSSIVVGAGTLNVAVGLTNAAEYYGAAGLGISDMASDEYTVMATMLGAAQADVAAFSVDNLAEDGFDLICEDATSTDGVMLWILGEVA